MKINEVELLLDIKKPNIRFYESKGLINPIRLENGYRDYSEEDVEKLKKIIVFRKIGISIEEIKSILDGEIQLSEAVEKNVNLIQEQMKELEGALRLSKVMLADEDLSIRFDVNKYWEAMEADEQQGLRFFDILKDYMEMESDIFYSMWENVFFTNMRKFTGGRKWYVVIAIILLICTVRGLACQFIWKSESFISGAVYPLLIFFGVSVIAFPLYFLNKKYGVETESVPCNNQKLISGCLISILKIIIAIIILLVLIIGVPILLESVYFSKIYAEIDNYIIVSNVYMIYAMISIFMLITFFWLSSKQGIIIDSEKNNILVCRLKKRHRIIVAASVFIAYMLATGLYMTCYTQIGDNGITKRIVISEQHYDYQDVEYFQLYANHDGTLQCRFCLKDGTGIKWFGGASSEKFDEELYDSNADEYFVALLKRITDMGCECRIKDEEKIFDKITYDYWDEVLEKALETIGYY